MVNFLSCLQFRIKLHEQKVFTEKEALKSELYITKEEKSKLRKVGMKLE